VSFEIAISLNIAVELPVVVYSAELMEERGRCSLNGTKKVRRG
jgi:hypothetical protein